MQLSVVIVNFNVQYFLEQCLLSVEKASMGLEVEVFVVDNNSVDGSVAMVQEKFPKAKLIANHQNLGFSTANNQAIRQSTGDYVLLLNPDTVVREDSFHKILQFMEARPQAGGLGVKMIDGSGRFLPESKRGFPSPFVAFSKTFGLSALFPKSKIFNHYHLGYLSPDETHEVDVLAGAFMLLRRSVLDEIGLLDEAFFMYGEDIDLSYRIVQAKYKNYYFADTTIIHYKGESTKKGSLNYVRTFYNAMIIFARKHFTGRQAHLYIAMIYGAIYLRAGLTLASNTLKKIALPLLDAALLFGGLFGLKYFWARYYYHDIAYYDPKFVWFNIPLYVLVWLGSVYFTGGYDERYNLRRLVRGLVIGTLVLSAIYGYLPLELRPSRAIVLLGAVWAVCSLAGLRTLIHLLRTGNLAVGRSRPENLVIVGSEAESERVRSLLGQAGVQKNFIGTVSPDADDTAVKPSDSSFKKSTIAPLNRLEEMVQIFKVDELIFCSSDVSSEEIMQWMTRLGSGIAYKIVPKESLSVIGSSSKDTAGELYTIEIRFNIATPMSRRNKRLFDLLAVTTFALFALPLLFFVKKKKGFLKNIIQVFFGKKTWVGYAGSNTDVSQVEPPNLPSIRPGVLSLRDGQPKRQLDGPTIRRLNFLYAKDYEIHHDLRIIWKSLRKLGN